MSRVIKVKKSTCKQELRSLERTVQSYEQAIISASANFKNVKNGLSGQSYTAEYKLLNRQLTEQKNLLVDCLAVVKTLENYIDEITQAEASVKFD